MLKLRNTWRSASGGSLVSFRSVGCWVRLWRPCFWVLGFLILLFFLLLRVFSSVFRLFLAEFEASRSRFNLFHQVGALFWSSLSDRPANCWSHRKRLYQTEFVHAFVLCCILKSDFQNDAFCRVLSCLTHSHVKILKPKSSSDRKLVAVALGLLDCLLLVMEVEECMAWPHSSTTHGCRSKMVQP